MGSFVGSFVGSLCRPFPGEFRREFRRTILIITRGEDNGVRGVPVTMRNGSATFLYKISRII